MNAEPLPAPTLIDTPSAHADAVRAQSRIYHFDQLTPHCLGFRFDVEAFRRATLAQLRAELDEVVRGDT
jgi:hypothetical protein